MPLWGVTEAEWDDDPVFWAFYGPVAPACPDALLGDRAPLMLGYLPDYYECTTHVRAILQSEGYEVDALRYYAEGVSTVVVLADAEPWHFAMWEATLGLPDRSGWADDDRRDALAYFVPETWLHQEDPILDFVSAQTGIDRGRMSLTDAVADYTLEFGLTAEATGERDLATHWLRLVVPSHLDIVAP